MGEGEIAQTYERKRTNMTFTRGKDGLLAMDVKDRVTRPEWPRDVYQKADELNDDTIQFLYEHAAQGFWHDAELLAQELGFNAVYAEGRSGGWLAIAGTENVVGDDLRVLKIAAWVPEGMDYWREVFYQSVRDYQIKICPNCLAQVNPDAPSHANECLVGALLRILEDRGVGLQDADLHRVDVDALMELGDQLVTDLAEQLSVPAYSDAES